MEAVQTGTLWFSRSDQLGDPCEGTRPQGDAKIFEAARQEILVHGEPYVQTMQTVWQGGDEYQKTVTYISCWQMRNQDMVGMWERYCRPKETGIAVQTTYERLDATVPIKNDENRYIMLGLVTYGDYSAPEFQSDPANVFSTFMIKNHHYEDEHEIRLVCNTGVKPVLIGFGVTVDWSALIQRVVVSPYADQAFVASVEKFCRDSGLVAPVVQSTARKVMRPYSGL